MGKRDRELIPAEALLTESHEYLVLEQDIARIGISHVAADKLGAVVAVEFQVEVGQNIEQGEAIALLETESGELEVFSPATGEVLGLNLQLESEPEVITHDCYGDGWILEMSPSAPAELEALMLPERYAAFVD
ncbi:MAG: biotin/lipoyl-containing protein [Vampirovibrionales bacterium]|nr:biotin/lipoyl-containing protein [Vampirovibrionales bacterium]